MYILCRIYLFETLIVSATAFFNFDRSMCSSTSKLTTKSKELSSKGSFVMSPFFRKGFTSSGANSKA